MVAFDTLGVAGLGHDRPIGNGHVANPIGWLLEQVHRIWHDRTNRLNTGAVSQTVGSPTICSSLSAVTWQTGLHNPDFTAFAELCGAKGFRVNHPDQLIEAVESGVAHPGPALVGIISGPPGLRSPTPGGWSSGRQLRAGSSHPGVDTCRVIVTSALWRRKRRLS